MAQQRKGGRSAKHMPQYSEDTMMARIGIGLVLAALGVLTFLAAVLGMKGTVFSALRSFAFGAGGYMTVLLPVFPVWGGVLVILSVRKRQPVRFLGLAFLLYLLILTMLTLCSSTASSGRAVPLMDYWQQAARTAGGTAVTDSFEAYLSRAWALGRDRHIGGGLLGMLLAWPLWKTGGCVFGAILTAAGIIAAALFLFRIDPKRVSARFLGKIGEHREKRDREQRRLADEDIMRRQEAASRNNAIPGYPGPARQDAYPPYAQFGAQNAQNYQPQRPSPVQTPAPVQNAFAPNDASRFVRADSNAIYDEQLRTAAPQKDSMKSRISKIFGGGQETGTQRPETGDSAFKRVPRVKTPAAGTQAIQTYMEATGVIPPCAEQAPTETAPQSPYQRPPANRPAQRTAAQGVQSVPQAQPVQTAPQPMHAAPQTVPPMTGPRRPQSPASGERTAWQQQLDARLNVAAVPAPAADKPARTLQKPKESWTSEAERPPWEEPLKPAEQAVVPIVPGMLSDAGLIDPDRFPPMKPAEETKPLRPYTPPPVSLLAVPKPPRADIAAEDASRAAALESTLQSFHIPAKVRQVTHGPAVSRFEMEIASGIRVSRVVDLNQNIAMDMEVSSVRIEAPIPGKALVGVEVPNRSVTPVTLREVLDTEVMRNAKSPLTVALGKDISGTPIVCDLEKMPHLLIAGATGSGKSVCINTMINSLLYRTSPRDVRMIMIDPKVVELQCYNGIPHLLIPVVSDPHKAAGALQWAVSEMMERYQKFSARGVRNIKGYNGDLQDGEEPMPRIVIIIDELADLMLACKKDVEAHIQRLAQLARAAGIHMVIATQRPSVNVITGVIKANIPSRIAFKVTSFVDSRTILDHPGAETLLGYGDMLYLPTGSFGPTRIQGCFLSDPEVNSITDFIRANNDAAYDSSIQDTLENQPTEGEASNPSVGDSDAASGADNMLAQAIEMTVLDRQVSTSMLQRKLKLGYARAARLVDEMEERGIVSAKDGAKPRQCLITREEFEQMKSAGLLD